MAKVKTVYVVRKHITDWKTGAEIRHEDYPQRFDTRDEALELLLEKEEKYQQTVEDYLDEGSTIREGRRYEIVSLEVPA